MTATAIPVTAATIVNTGKDLLDLGSGNTDMITGSKFALCIHPSSNAMPSVCHLDFLCLGHSQV